MIATGYRFTGNCGAYTTGDRTDALTTETDQTAQVVATLDASYGRLQGCSGQDLNHGHSHLVSAFGGNNTSGAIDVSTTLTAHGGLVGRLDFERETFIAHTLRGEGFDASEDGTERGTPLVPVAFSAKDHGADVTVDQSPTLRAMGHAGSHANGGGQVAVAMNFQASQSGTRVNATVGTLDANCGPRRHNGVLSGSAVRRLTPRECERLQGFPDDYTLILRRNAEAADGPRYKALGNSMAVNVMRWIGERIEQAVATAAMTPPPPVKEDA